MEDRASCLGVNTLGGQGKIQNELGADSLPIDLWGVILNQAREGTIYT